MSELLDVLGNRYKCKLTGFEGVATASTEFLNGCLRVALEPVNRTPQGEVIPAQAFDVQQLELVEGVKRVSIKAFEPKTPMHARVLDRITGIEGVVVARAAILGGSPEVGIQRTELKSTGVPAEVSYVFESRIQIIKDVPKETKKKDRPGGPDRPGPTSPSDRVR